MTAQDMINAIRKGETFRNNGMRKIADELERLVKTEKLASMCVEAWNHEEYRESGFQTCMDLLEEAVERVVRERTENGG